jgi:hypothetical protein
VPLVRPVTVSGEAVPVTLSAPGLDKAGIAADAWQLPGLRVSVEAVAGVQLAGVEWCDHPRYGRCLDVRYATPAEPTKDAPTMMLRPER